MTLSSEALAVVPKLAEWNAIFMSSDNGDGRLTGESFVPNFFRANTSGPMGTRAVSLYLRQAGFQEFLRIGHGLCWGRNSIGVFKDEVKKAGKNFVVISTPRSARKIIQPTSPNSPVWRRRVLPGDARRRQQRISVPGEQYRLGDKVQLADRDRRSQQYPRVGEAAVGLIGSSRYTFTFPGEANAKFVAAGGRNTAPCRMSSRASNGRQAWSCKRDRKGRID